MTISSVSTKWSVSESRERHGVMPDEKYEKLARAAYAKALGAITVSDCSVIDEFALALERVALEAKIEAYKFADYKWGDDAEYEDLSRWFTYQMEDFRQRLEELNAT